MTITGLTPEQKILFLNTLIKKTAPDFKERFLSLYFALGDDLFLVFSILEDLTLRFPGPKEFRGAQLSVENLSIRKVPTEVRPGTTHKVTVPHSMKYLDITEFVDPQFIHTKTRVAVAPKDLEKREIYFSPDLDQYIYVLAPATEMLGRTWVLYADRVRDVDLSSSIEIDSDEQDDFLSS